MDYLHEEEDVYDSDDEAGGGGGGISRRRPRKSKIIKRLKRMSVVVAAPLTSRMSTGSGRSGRGVRRGAGDDEEDDDSFNEDESADFYGFGSMGGFLKRNNNKHKHKNNNPNTNSSQKTNKKGRNSKHAALAGQKKEGKRRSLHLSHGSLSRASPSRSLRMSLLRKSRKDEAEEGDVVAPLPGQVPNEEHDEDDAENKSKKEKKQKKGNGRSKSNPPKKTRSLRTIKDALTSKSDRGTRSRSRSRRRSSNNSDDRSVDSPPSVASTVNSAEGMRLQQQQMQRRGNTASILNLGSALPFSKRNPDDETGASMEAMSLDYYYQSFPWIIKNWIYFLTVVVPFSILYLCFVGIFHSTTLHQNPVLRKVSISNMLFCGLGCTYRSSFMARQALDARGVHAVLKGAYYGRNNSDGNGITSSPKKALPSALRNKGAKSRAGGSKLGSAAAAALRSSVTNLRVPRVRRKTMPVGTSVNLGNLTKSILPSSEHRTNAFRTSSMGLGAAASASYNNAATSSASASQRSISIGHNSNPTNNNTTRHLQQNVSSRRGTGAASASNNLGGIPSVWDVDRMLNSVKSGQSKPVKARPSMDKHASIMEIYEVHATDEKVGILQ